MTNPQRSPAGGEKLAALAALASDLPLQLLKCYTVQPQRRVCHLRCALPGQTQVGFKGAAHRQLFNELR